MSEFSKPELSFRKLAGSDVVNGDTRGFATLVFYCVTLLAAIYFFCCAYATSIFKDMWGDSSNEYLLHYRPRTAQAWVLTEWGGQHLFLIAAAFILFTVSWWPIQKSLHHSTARVCHKIFGVIFSVLAAGWLLMLSQLLFRPL